MSTQVTTPEDAEATPRRPELPEVQLPSAPAPAGLWSRAFVLLSVGLALYLLDRFALLLMDYWLLESLDLGSVFWTNFWTAATLFAVSLVLTTAAVAVPAFVHDLSREARRRALAFGIFVGVLDDVVFGALVSTHFRKYLLAFNATPFGEADPVFGHDLGFYVFQLPAIWTTWYALMWILGLGLASAVFCAWLANRHVEGSPESNRFFHWVGVVSTPYTRAIFAATVIVGALGVWLRRYTLLVKDNSSSSIYRGAEYIDVAGILSTKNALAVSTVVLIVAGVLLSWRLGLLHRLVTGRGTSSATDWRRVSAFGFALIILPGLGVDLGFKAAVALKDQLQATPNEPVIQLPYIERHIEATRTAWGLDEVETVPFTPKGTDDPVPAVEDVLEHPAMRNVALWPGFMARLERLLDPQHADRVFLTGGDEVIYSPSMDIFRQQQQLRPYYDFMDVDTVRYEVDDEPRMFASAVRELPLVEPQPWLAWWGQQYVLFTHGHGLVAADVAEVREGIGEPIYASRNVPAETDVDALAVENPAVYYGEGSGSVAFTNVDDINEFDFATPQGRSEVRYPEDVGSGVDVNSPLKRAVFGWKSNSFLDIFFSDLISDDTRVHYYRTPLERVERIAPFLFLDTDPYAVATGDGITWMVNAMTTTDRYPYSMIMDLGDKSNVRTPTRRDPAWVNYAADSVKATVDAYTGDVTLYQISDEPIVQTWARIYPDLFVSGDDMPEAIDAQRQYPPQLLHAQFDDLYIYYHMTDPVEFFNLEDLWDDGDEVLGPIIDIGDSVTFSIEPYYWIAETGGDNGLPETNGPPTQFVQSMIFTPENATNLRSIVSVYQERGDYGRLVALNVPKGEFFPGPEQADAAIDQDAAINAQFNWWDRQGAEIVRGHTTPLIVDGELIYVEPIFIKSEQNPTPQLKRVVVVFRGQPGMGRTLEEALRLAIEGGSDEALFGGAALDDGTLGLPAGQTSGAEGEDDGPPPHAGTPEAEAEDTGRPSGNEGPGGG